jgi:hypothetical protein
MNMKNEQVTSNENLISHCGLFCGACPTYKSGKCAGCRGDSPKCGIGYKKCPVKQCCAENGFFTCADCTKYASTKECKKYNPVHVRFGEWISGTCRGKGVEMIREKGRTEFIAFMTGKDWLTVKTRDSFLNKNLGSKLKEK